MFVNEDSSVWASFGEICYNGTPFSTVIKETRGAEIKIPGKDAGHTLPYSGYPAKR